MAAAQLPQNPLQPAYSFADLITKKLKDAFNLAKLASRAFTLIYETAPYARAVNRSFSQITAAFALLNGGKELLKLPEKIYDFVTDMTSAHLEKLSLAICDTMCLSFDCWEWAKYSGVAIYAMPSLLSTAIPFALLAAASYRSCYDLSNFLVEDDQPLQNLADKLNQKLPFELAIRGRITEATAENHMLAGIIKNVTFAAMGAFILLSTYTTYAVSAPIILLVKAIALTASISKTYFETAIDTSQPLIEFA